MTDYETHWTFETENIRVTLAVAPEDDLDLSWDDDGSIREGLESGKYIAFIARVQIAHKGIGVLHEEYLGGCIYESVEQFLREKEYFSDMVRECVRQARKKIAAQKTFPLRLAQEK